MLLSVSSVLMNILYIVIAIVVLLTMVLIHELGHYVAGRILGFKITEFSVGFGKVLWQKTNKRGEKISLRIFPLGGFCAFLGENDDDTPQNGQEQEVIDVNNTSSQPESQKVSSEPEIVIPDSNNEGRFNDQKPWKRIIVFLAGVTFNFLSAFIFAIIFLCVGGYNAYVFSPTSNQAVILYSATEPSVEVGVLQDNTVVSAINGVEINYAHATVYSTIVDADATSVVLTIYNNGESYDVIIKRTIPDKDGNLIFGVNYGGHRINYTFGNVLAEFVPFTFNISGLILTAFWQIITGQVALSQLGGPVSTISQMTQMASSGIVSFLYLLPFLSANLAIFNILPIPGLDGAHVVFTTIEWIRGKPIRRDVENAIHAWGIIALFAFVIFVDIYHLIVA